MKQIKQTSKILSKWTEQAIECYKLRCNCSLCQIKNIMESRCEMKNIVVELVKKHGAPNIERNDII